MNIQPFLEMLEAKTPFCLVRYNDGEMMGVEKHGVTVARGDQFVNPTLNASLRESLKYRAENYWIGLPCPECWPKHHALAKTYVEDDYEHQTLAVVLTNDNWLIASEAIPKAVQNRCVVLVTGSDQDWTSISEANWGEPYRHYMVPTKNAWESRKEIEDEYARIPENAVVMMACGPMSRILSQRWYAKRPDLTVLDVGSTFDPMTRGVQHRCHKWTDDGTQNMSRWCSVCNTKGKQK